MKIKEIPITFKCNCPDGKHKCGMKRILGPGNNKKVDKMYLAEVNGETHLLSHKPIK